MRYKLHGGGKMHDGRKVYRIKALEDFGDVRVGDLGGYIESEGNLSQKSGDTSWVYDDSIVYGRGEVLGDSKVYKNAIIQDSRIEGDSRVSHGATIQHSRITGDSVVQDANVFYGSVEDLLNFALTHVEDFHVREVIEDKMVDFGYQQPIVDTLSDDDLMDLSDDDSVTL